MLTLLLATTLAADPDPVLVAKPDAFPTLVNPNCSHCVDEAKRRKDDLRPDDPVLCRTRGDSDGGAIPIRFFLNAYRVISDRTGVYVYDPDAGYARGFAPGKTFVFHGWRNGVVVMKDKSDETLYSGLTGEAFAGPRKGHRLTPIPTLVSTWEDVITRTPNAMTFRMSEKYRPIKIQKVANANSVASRPTEIDPRLTPDEPVLGVRVGNTIKAYPLTTWHTSQWYGEYRFDTVGGVPIIVAWITKTKTATAYRQVARPPQKANAFRPNVKGASPPKPGVPPNAQEVAPVSVPLVMLNLKGGPVLATKGGTNADSWDIAGRCENGTYKGWELEPVDAVVCLWRAWSAEYPATEIAVEEKPNRKRRGPK